MARPVSRHGGRRQYGRSPMAPTGSEAGGNFMFPDSPSPSYGGEFVPSPPPTERPASRRRGRIHDPADPTASPTATPNNTPETGHVRKMRPRSAKGRPRPGSARSPDMTGSPISASPPMHGSPVMRPSSREDSGIDILALSPPARPTSALSRYRVLPSIGPRPGTASEDSGVDGISHGMDHMTLTNQSGHSTGEPRKRHRKRSTEEETYPQSSSSQRTNQGSEDLRRKNRHDARIQDETKMHHRPTKTHQREEGRMQDGDDRRPQDEQQDKEAVQTPKRPVSATWLARIPVPHEPGVNQDRLLLALKLPGGQRLQRHFHATDTLSGILAYAQTQTDQKLGTCEIAVQGTPQRLFTSSDFKMTIAEAEIHEKTLLYIQADEEEEEDDGL
ncbi:PREDICTED: UBX domain-containing protein 10-like [Branchiostoma belcheri]|uniref:UBX domain-containing protein 10-like n=1 Tax=Branchiostoma belcheri TaxID=7741 RepID=A0A6P4YFP7_BRABE|nr:PREDICTED: UBX domain-containing protein 10-like [Branchiostoma belcheri]